ncbi:hypothetical protein KM043_000403 [Ampulex compressa]|nr:hypothetical protein KM043_000403 [Ampulex compressa]
MISYTNRPSPQRFFCEIRSIFSPRYGTCVNNFTSNIEYWPIKEPSWWVDTRRFIFSERSVLVKVSPIVVPVYSRNSHRRVGPTKLSVQAE